MDHGDFATADLQLRVQSVVRDMSEFRADDLDETTVAVVVAEHKMNGAGKALGQLLDHERRAQVAAMQQNIRASLSNLSERLVQIPDVVVAVGENRDFGHERRWVRGSEWAVGFHLLTDIM